ncbi:MAG: electron transport complex subunit RsxC [Rhodocyclaceae bacterium]|nr:electron transport complex subunit RsxC [Rhodocyclaceae bacterium]
MGLIEKVFSLLEPAHWGIHPVDRKRPAADCPVRGLPLPERLYVPLQQHIGAAARPIVLVGQTVLKGQLLAEAQGATSAAVHASTSGSVTAIGDIGAPHPSGLSFPAVTIAADGADRWADTGVSVDPFSLPPQEIAKRVAAAGVVGLGGATFPSALKLGLGLRSKIHTLILNGGECEPYLSCDDRLMRDAPDEIVDGIRIMLHATGAQRALVGIEDNKPEAIAALTAAARDFPAVLIRSVPARYPMGSEKHLLSALTGQEVPADGRTTDLGALVHNVGTAWAVHEALRQGRPLVERLVTLNGGAIDMPGNIRVPVGALVEDVLAFVGLKTEPARLVMGGPMMGNRLPHARVPVVKGTSGILALTANEATTLDPGPCIRCSSCVRACPVGLLPLEMSARIGIDDLNGAVAFGLKDCIACGCCSFVCPSRIPLVHYFNHAKGELAAQGRAQLRNESAKRLAAARTERLAREAQEKAAAAARRKAERAAQKAAAAKEAAGTTAAGAAAAAEAEAAQAISAEATP